ncbi:MAG: hypothetical protein M1136_09065 [Chloroflexi bacterium]|nr:hypothetical protein [Chloroflexota bacterium]
MDIFAGTQARKVELHMLEETYQEAQRLIRENGWDEEEGLLIIFANGLAYLKEAHALPDSESDSALTLMSSITERCAHFESMYAVMKFRAYYLNEDKRILELNVTGLQADNDGLRHRINLFRQDEARLKEEIKRLTTENTELHRHLAELQGNRQQDEPTERQKETILSRISALLSSWR